MMVKQFCDTFTPSRWMVWASAILVLLSFAIRTYRIDEAFLFFGDQALYWNWIQIPFSGLPNHGTPRVVGGHSYGPIFFYVLWCIWAVLGPLCDNLPHAGGYGQAGLHAAADGVLVYALLRRRVPIGAVLAFGILLVSSPLEASLSGTIWNPGLAVTFAHLGLGIFLLTEQSMTRVQLCLICMCSVLALQAHTPAIFLAGALIIVSVLQRWRHNQHALHPLLKDLLAVGGTLIVLEIPYLKWLLFEHVDLVQETRLSSQGVVFFSTGWSQMNPVQFFPFIMHWIGMLIADPLMWIVDAWEYGLVLALLPIGFARWRYDLGPALVVVLALSGAIVCFSLLGIRPEAYWLMTLMAPALLVMVIGVNCIESKTVQRAVSVLLVCIAVYGLPQRFAKRDQLTRMNEYGRMVAAVRRLHAQNVAISSIQSHFIDTDKTNIEDLYRFIGGDLQLDAPAFAIIDPTGQVRVQTQE